MKKEGVKRFSLILALFIIFLSGFAFAEYLEIISLNSGSFTGNITTIDEDVYVLYNITINSTSLNTNITSVNITLPNGFSLGDGGISTTAFNSSFQLGARSMNWTNTSSGTGLSGLINASKGAFFTFNLTSPAPGRYNISIKIDSIERNLTVHVNDSTMPFSISMLPATGPFNVGGGSTNISNSTIYINVTANDTHGAINTFNISLLNSTGRVHANSTYDFSKLVLASDYLGVLTSANTGANGSGAAYFFGLPDDAYTLKVDVNDSSDNRYYGYFNTTIKVDTISPTVDLTSDVVEGSELTITIVNSDATSGVESCSVTGGRNPIISGTANFKDTGLTCSNEYSYVVTCTDYAGNEGTSGSKEFRTGSCSASNSGGGGSSTNTWTKTYAENNEEISERKSISKEIRSKERVRILFSGEDHNVGILKVSNNIVTVEVASTPQQKELGVGESAKFDLNGDSYYDIMVLINSVENGLVDMVINYIEEKVIVEEEQQESSSEDGVEKDLLNQDEESNSWTWIIVIIIVLAIVAGVIYWIKRK